MQTPVFELRCIFRVMALVLMKGIIRVLFQLQLTSHHEYDTRETSANRL